MYIQKVQFRHISSLTSSHIQLAGIGTDRIRNSLVTITTDEGIEGHGVVGPRLSVVDEILNSSKDECGLLIPKISQQEISFDTLVTYLNDVSANSYLRNAFHMAYYDLLGKIEGKPVFKFLSSSQHAAPSALTVYIHDSEDETRREIERNRVLCPGLKVVKLKIQEDVSELKRLELIARLAPEVEFILDANRSFSGSPDSIELLLKVIETLGGVDRVRLLEEPFVPGNFDAWHTLAERTKVPLFLDESCLSKSDFESLLVVLGPKSTGADSAVKGINIKLQKYGIDEASQILMRARNKNLQVMLGCMFEMHPGISVTDHFGYAFGGELLAIDGDGANQLPDIFKGLPQYQDGNRIPHEKTPGLGVLENFSDRSLQKFEFEISPVF